MITFTTASSGRELGESVTFQPVLQAYPTCHSWMIMAHVSLGQLECHWKAFNRQLIRTCQLLHFLNQQPSALTQLLSTLQVELPNIEDVYNSCKTTIISAIDFITHQFLIQWTITDTHLPQKKFTAIPRRCPQVAYRNCNNKRCKQH